MLSLVAILTSFASFGMPIYGTLGICTGDYQTVYTDSVAGGPGIWSSSNTAVASIGSGSYRRASVYGISAGTSVISYTIGGIISTAVFTVTPTPAAVTGPSDFCSGVTVTYADATAGGTWSITNIGSRDITASIGATSGVATATVSPAGSSGDIWVTYTVGPGCSVSEVVSIDITDVGRISYSAPLCPGATDTKTNSVTGGIWSSSNTAIATIDATSGLLTGISGGTVYISYTVGGTCGAATIWDTVTILPATITPVLTGVSVMTGEQAYVYSSVGRIGTWSSSNTAIATVSSDGQVTGIAPGTTTIAEIATGCSGPVTGTTTVTVQPFTGISGNINFTGPAVTGPVRVWLITYDTSFGFLYASQSRLYEATGASSLYYQFPVATTDSYRVKAAVSGDTLYSVTGYVPTYHTSSLYWHDADVIYHTSGVADINKDINMLIGTGAIGPGFISGFISSGAKKGVQPGAHL